MTTIIADSGSTKTDWSIIENNSRPTLLHTQGINPALMTDEDIEGILNNELLPQMETKDETTVHFYGAGVRQEMIPQMQRVFEKAFAGFTGSNIVEFSFHSDLLAAARAVCGKNEGIACILGTGANSCLYDGAGIVQNTPALGFILGDEGGGAALGKRFLNAIFKGELPQAMRDDYLKTTQLTLADIIRKVYKEPMPNRFLASTSLYIKEHLDNQQLQQLIVDNFRLFVQRNLKPYGRKDLPVGVVGSIGWHYRELLAEAIAKEGYTLGCILKSPMEGLIRYHNQ